MPALPTILVDGDGTSGWTGSYTDIDELIASANDSDMVATPNGAVATAFFLLQDMPSDFETMTSLTLNIRYRQSGRQDDTMGLFAQVFAADESTALTNEFTVNAAVTATTFGNSGVLNFTGVSAGDKTTWDGARIRLRCTYSQNMAKDTSFTIDVSALQLGGVYVAVIPPIAKAGTDTLTIGVVETASILKSTPDVERSAGINVGANWPTSGVVTTGSTDS